MNRNDENIIKVMQAFADRLLAQDARREEELLLRKQIQEAQVRIAELQGQNILSVEPTDEERELLRAWARGEDVLAAKLAYDRDGSPRDRYESVVIAQACRTAMQQNILGQVGNTFTFANLQAQQGALGLVTTQHTNPAVGAQYANLQSSTNTHRTV